MKDKYRHARAAGSLQAMCRFLIEDLERAVNWIGGDEYPLNQFKMTIDHGKRLLARVQEDLK